MNGTLQYNSQDVIEAATADIVATSWSAVPS